MENKVPLKPGDREKPYYKFYEKEIADPTEEQWEMIKSSKGTAEEALSIFDRNLLLEPGMYPAKTGYYPLNEGGLLVAGNIPMPNVTAEMLYWWWPWHSLDPFRYTIWDNEDHFDVKLNEEGRRRALDPSVPMEEKTWGATHTVLESIGGPAGEIVIMFQNPADLGYDAGKIGTKDCEFIVAANAVMGGKFPVVMTEVAKEIDGVMTFMARFWVGYKITDGKVETLMPTFDVLPGEFEKIAQMLIGHNIKEFTNLGKILPDVYAEFGPDIG
ncbi:MAG: DAPG hydrolase family protein [Anaerovoracaceae bacterium]|jgi:hypothetical protein